MTRARSVEADSFAALLGKLWVEFWPEEARPLVQEALGKRDAAK